MKTMDAVLKELEKNHNHSWFEEIYIRNHKWINDTAMFYRGTTISYDKMFDTMKRVAVSLDKYGVCRGMEIAVCMSNTPEFIYVMGAASILGAKINVFSVEFARDYIVEILNGCDSGVLFIEDTKYLECAVDIEKSNIQRIIVSSLVDSLPVMGNPFEQFDSLHGRFVDKKSECKKIDDSIIGFSEMISVDSNQIQPVGELDDEFLITYSSGTTEVKRPKGIVHNTRSLITIGRCHDPEIQKTASMKDFVIMASIPTQSNTDIISSISDSFMQGATVALEPVYDQRFFVYSLIINRPDYLVATRCFWVYFAKQVLYNKKFSTLKLPELFVVFAVGEPLEINEEILINRALKRVDAGKKRFPIAIVRISTAGGDCEHGGLFWLIFRAWQNLKPYNLIHKQEQGLKAFNMVEVAVLDKEGNHCKANQYGRLVANSPCNMKEYKNNPEATSTFWVKDINGKVWADCKVYSYIDSRGGIHMKGRIPAEGETVPTFMIAAVILKDTKHILSCEVVHVADKYVAHIELQPGFERSKRKILQSMKKRLEKRFEKEVLDNLMYRIRTTKESFPITGCGKRDVSALIEEGQQHAKALQNEK